LKSIRILPVNPNTLNLTQKTPPNLHLSPEKIVPEK
jgi:hypothetical protein